MLEKLRSPWTDRRAELLLGAVSLSLGVLIVAMVAFVTSKGWQTLANNSGVGWLGSGGKVDEQLGNMLSTGVHPPSSAYHVRAWPLLYGTLLTTALALAFGLALGVLSSIFIVELAPARLRRLVIPVVRLLASVPSVVWGLIGILVLVPFVGNHLITAHEKESVQNVVQLTGQGLLVTFVILTVMITPIIVALTCEALSSVPNSWREGAIALGVNPVRAMLAVTLRAARPAIVAAAVLATARALGEAIMISMVSGGYSFAPKPIDGLPFLFEPLRTVASAIVDYREGVGAPALSSTLYAFALLLLFSAFVLSVGGYLMKQPMRRYQVRG